MDGYLRELGENARVGGQARKLFEVAGSAAYMEGVLPRIAFVLTLLAAIRSGFAEPPKSVDERLVVELVAKEPQIRTPTAIAVDPQGRVWVLENNTHFRPKNYDAPPTDRVVILDNFGADGLAARLTVFADGFRNGMGMRLLPDGGVIVSTRAEVFRFRDTKGAGSADERVSLVKLDTTDDYPHDGLSGLALDRAGHLFIALGENHGMPWKVIGSDGSEVRGSDEGGIFRCTLAGGEVERWALGLWNPFGLVFDDQGRLFALDNDPGAGSFCRLLHVVRDGDYGYRYRYGRTVDHPFLSWFGQIPGTLPPVCLVGEAPTGILQCHGPSLPYEYDGQLLGCTWDDHGIQRFPLEKRGASFGSKPEWLVRGGNDFRPSAIAQAPDGSLVIADWADSSYEVHGKGRVWRVRAKEARGIAPVIPPKVEPSAPELPKPPAADAGDKNARMSVLLGSLHRTDPFEFHDAIEALIQEKDLEFLMAHASERDEPRVRLGVLLTLRRSHAPEAVTLIPGWLADVDGSVRRAALQWIAEEHLSELQPRLDAALATPLSRATFEAYLATIQMLVSGKPDARATITQTRAIAEDTSRPADLRALAVRLLPTDTAAISAADLHHLIEEKTEPVRKEAVRILAARHDDASQAELRGIATDAQNSASVRADAIAGLTFSAGKPETDAILRGAVESGVPALKNEAFRAMRGHFPAELFESVWKTSSGPDREQLLMQVRSNPALQKLAVDQGQPAAAPLHPAPDAPWPAVLSGTGDPEAGRRIFYHPNGPRCYTCHTIEGHGGNVGPDLTQIWTLSPEELLTAIRQPSKDIAPAYTNWLLTLKDGRQVSGIDLFLDDKDAAFLVDATGKQTRVKVADTVSREPLPVSLMPPGLDALMTEGEMRDLIAFLKEARE